MIGYKLIEEKRWKDINQKFQKLNDDIALATEFVREIERGNLDAFIGTTDSGLTGSLVSMRDQMKKYSLIEKQRNWVNEGLAKFIQILRSGNNDKKHLADSILRNLVDYLKANQGALLALNDENPEDLFLEMEACYAYDRKKFIQKRIELGEGPAGQSVLEKSTIYLTDIPDNFVKITSGLGEALPRNLLIVPLKLDEEVFGIIELASFQIFQPYEIEFVERLSESIAAAVAAVKGTERTTTLLRETQLQAEQLKAQEEEVRQNLEELSATQEAMQRAMKEVEGKEAYVSQILNTSRDVIYTVDREFRILMWNAAFAREAERINVRIEKGMNAFSWSPEQRRQLIPLFQRALDGETFEFKWEGDLNGRNMCFLSVYAPIRSESGEIIEAGIYATDITPIVEAQQESARLLKDAQHQSEELKAQEEELRQNMEELSATQDAMQRAMTDLEIKEAYASELLNATDDLIYTVDKDFRFVTWNKAFTELMGSLNLSLEKGMNAFEWLPDYRSSLIPSWTRALNGETFQFQFEGERDGQKDHYLAIYAPVRLKTGEIQEAVVFAKNVGELVEAQQQSARLLKEAQHQAEELKAQEEELRQNMEELSATQETMEQKTREVGIRENYMTQLLNVSQDVIFTVDQDFKLVTWNNSFARTIDGLHVRLEKGIIAFGWRSDDERQYFAELFKRVFRGESFETRVESNFDGTVHHFLSTFSPLRNKANEITEAVVFARDITKILNGDGAPVSSPKEDSGEPATRKVSRGNSPMHDETLR